MCNKSIHNIITEDGPACGFNIRSIAELSRLTGIDKRILYKRMERLGKDKNIKVDRYLSPPKSMKKYKPRKRHLTIEQQCRQAGVKRGTYQSRRKKGASHNQALGFDFMRDRRYKLKYITNTLRPNLHCQKRAIFCYGTQFDSLEEIAYVFDVNKNRVERLFKRGLSIEEALEHRDSKNRGLVTFPRLERSEKLRNLPAKLYFAIVYWHGRKLIKVGYTTKNIDERLKQISKKYKVLFHASDILYEIFKAEQFICEAVIYRGYDSCEIDVDGRSEIFEYSGRLENVIWDCLELTFGREAVDNYIDFIH